MATDDGAGSWWRRAARALQRVYGLAAPYVVGLLVSLLALLAVVQTAINTQSGRIPDAEGHGWAFRTLFGPGWVLNGQGWTVVTSQLDGPRWELFQRLMTRFLVADTLIALIYGGLLLLVMAALGRTGRWYRVSQLLVGVLVAVDLVENVAAAGAVWFGSPTGLVVVLSVSKWALVVAVAVLAGLRLVVPLAPDERQATPAESARRRLGRGARAVLHQRFSYLPVLAIAVLSLPSGAAILEQLPDVQRRWVTDGSIGVRHAVAAVLATALLGVFLIMVGRHRTRYALEHPEPDDPRPGDPVQTVAGPAPAEEPRRQRLLRLGVWLTGPAVALVGALVVLAAGRADLIRPLRLVVWVAVPVLIVASSVVIRRLWTTRAGRRPRLQPRPDRPVLFTAQDAAAVGTAGYLAGLAMLAVGGLSLWRSLMPLVILPPETYRAAGDPYAPGAISLLLGVGLVGVIAPWLVVIGTLVTGTALPELRPRAEAPTAESPTAESPTAESPTAESPTAESPPAETPVARMRTGLDRHGAWGLLGLAALVFLGLGFLPSVAAWIGLSATAILALGSLAGMISAVGLILQDYPTAEVFRLLRLRRTPLVSLVAATVVLVGIVGGRGSIHAVDPGAAPPAPAADGSRADPRPTVAATFQRWLAVGQTCTVRVGGRPVRPMLMVAAEGGGIRAAYWTVRGLQAIEEEICPASPTLLSGGASGGSVGLTVAHFSQSGGGAVEAVRRMAEPQTLTRAADGTFVRDLIYGTSGVPVPRLGEADGWDWRDRARLIEDGWRTSGTWGTSAFLAPGEGAASTGQLVLNSTSVKDNCRVFVSQVRIGGPRADESPSYDPEKTCDKDPSAAPRTIDLFSAYGPYGREPTSPGCLGLLSAPTAALLTARFPYVTPSGVIGPCPDRKVTPGQQTVPYWSPTQLVDGGYIENTGLATLTDLADQWLPLVRAENDAALADRTGRRAVIVPIVVFLTNGDRNVTQPALDTPPTSELSVPVLTILRSGSALDDSQALLARARDAVELPGFCAIAAHAAACGQLGRGFPNRVVVVERATQPEIGAPLGWVLSAASMTALDRAMAAQQRDTCRANTPWAAVPPGPVPSESPDCANGYATVGDLARYFQPPPAAEQAPP